MKPEDIFRPKVALPIITVIALIMRLVPLRYEYMFGYDPYFHLAYIEEALKAGKWFNFFTIAGGPWGFQIKNFHPLGLWMTPAYVYKFLSVFGVSLYDAFRITPVIFGVLTIVFLYLAMLNFYGEKEAFFSGLFLAVSFGHIFRSMANYYRGDNYMLFWYSMALFGISLALTKTRRKWRYKRLAFYLIPAFASGLASIFWQAYYPIFIFLLGNAILLAFGAFIMGRDKYLLDSGLLAVSTAFGTILANYLGKYFGYCMLGGSNWLAKKTAEKLGIELGAIKDVYLVVHLKYLVPLALAGILVLFLLSRVLKDRKQRALIVVMLSIIGVYLLFARFEALKELSSGFGIFKEAPILETRHSTFSDIWAAYSILVFLCPLFLLRFASRKAKLPDFLLLGLILPSLYMVYTWTRFLFIGSMAIATMAGVGVVSLHDTIYPRVKSKFDYRKALALSVLLLVVVPVTSAGLGLERVLAEKPFMNKNWENALLYLGNHSNENDIVLAWWDYGHWVTYYARRSPIAQGSPNSGVALYYLGKLDENWAINLGVDYVVVSYYDFLKFRAIVETADSHPKYNITEKYGLLVLPLTSEIGALVFQKGNYRIVVKPGNEWSAIANINGNVLMPKELYVEYQGRVMKPNLTNSNSNTYLYINLNYKYAVFMNEEAFNTTLAKLFITPKEPYELVYSDGGFVKILKLKHPNVRVEKANGRVIFHFENATGTGLGIWGFMDNGTLVFKKWYNVKGKNEFELPEEVNGTVIRYAYAVGKKIVDRGIFRRG
ncbi:glycosyltransferase family 39 protein [Thermococcus aggregans]|uniref:dolichyl-phosphooligosaccharide-protein glycotransferase n=1 Tax=Thermococcus aggregans TaxID=110163 RepID=A0A9E7MY43_THEAG|nr:STT3 domain-containing protein [Thermococcus aggregans]USS41071.1 glycosyltransferase family 39 protein [Thermococcus aggregans]